MKIYIYSIFFFTEFKIATPSIISISKVELSLFWNFTKLFNSKFNTLSTFEIYSITNRSTLRIMYTKYHEIRQNLPYSPLEGVGNQLVLILPNAIVSECFDFIKKNERSQKTWSLKPLIKLTKNMIFFICLLFNN